MDEILNALGLTYDQLTLDEQSTLNEWLSQMETKGVITRDEEIYYLERMKDEVGIKLTEEPEGTVRNVFLKARYMNYQMLLGFLKSPEEARKELNNYIQRLKLVKRK